MRTLLYTILFILAASMAQAAGTIVLVVDISSSLSISELDRQYDSYANVLRSIPYLDGVNIEVVLFHDEPQHVSSGSALAAAAVFDELPRTDGHTRGLTCLNNALQYVEIMLPTLPQPVVIDISGDGDANCDGWAPQGHYGPLYETLDRIAAQGITVNTLFMMDEGIHDENSIGFEEYQDGIFTPTQFYESLLRNNGFNVTAHNIMHFEEALFRKLSRELAQLQ